MSGQELKDLLTKNGYALKDVAAKLGMTQPNFSQLMKVQDVKSGTLEEMCMALGKKMDFFYKGTVYAPVVTEEKENEEIIRLRAENDVLREIAGLQKKKIVG